MLFYVRQSSVTTIKKRAFIVSRTVTHYNCRMLRVTAIFKALKGPLLCSQKLSVLFVVEIGDLNNGKTTARLGVISNDFRLFMSITLRTKTHIVRP
jgi:hypothetical protein